MSDTAADQARMKEFLNFATRESGATIEFGTQYDEAEATWRGAMRAGTAKCTFSPGAGRAFIREMRDIMTGATRDLTKQLRANMGEQQYHAIFAQLENACKLAMQRNAAGARPTMFAPTSFND